MNDPMRRPPLILSYRQLKQVLMPYAVGYRWAEDTIHDLWKIGAPVPDPGQVERRIIFPGQLYKWLTDVLTRQGQPVAHEADVYRHLRGLSNE